MQFAHTRIRLALGFAAMTVLTGTALCPAQFADLATRVPDGTNAVFLIDVDQIMRSAMATQEGWRNQKQEMYDSGLLMVPPEASQILAGAKFDFQTVLPAWQISLMKLDREPSLPEVVVRFNGTLDKVGQHSVAVLPGESYLVQLGSRMIGFGGPANRQDVARWLRRADNGTLVGLSPDLQKAKQFAQQNAHVIVSVDLEDVVCAEEVKSKLAAFKSLEAKEIDLDKASQALASIRGATLGITVTDRRNGALRVDFNQDISVIHDVAKPLLLEVLGNQGMLIDEFHDWDVQVSEKEVRLRGLLEDSGTRRLMSFLDTPPSLQPSPVRRGDVQADDEQARKHLVGLTTQQYFHSITTLLRDLRNDKRDRRTMGQISVFFRNYARRIDRLPILNVAPEMIGFGRWVSTSLREGQMGVTEAAGRSRSGQMDVSQANGMNRGMPIGGWGGGWGGFCPRAADRADLQARARVRTQERLQGTMSATLILQAIDEAAADMRMAMTQKYNREF